MGESCRIRYWHARRRCTSIPPAFGLMTYSARGFSNRCALARCDLAAVRATVHCLEPSPLDVEHPSMRRERTADSAPAVQYSAMVQRPGGVVHMPGEQSTSVSDPIRREWETCGLFVVGGGLNPSESLAVARHSAHGFAWGDGESGACSAAARHRQGERRCSLPSVQVGGHCASAAGGLHPGDLHGPRLACLAVRAVSVFRRGATPQSRTKFDASDVARCPSRLGGSASEEVLFQEKGNIGADGFGSEPVFILRSEQHGSNPIEQRGALKDCAYPDRR